MHYDSPRRGCCQSELSISSTLPYVYFPDISALRHSHMFQRLSPLNNSEIHQAKNFLKSRPLIPLSRYPFTFQIGRTLPSYPTQRKRRAPNIPLQRTQRLPKQLPAVLSHFARGRLKIMDSTQNGRRSCVFLSTA